MKWPLVKKTDKLVHTIAASVRQQSFVRRILGLNPYAKTSLADSWAKYA